MGCKCWCFICKTRILSYHEGSIYAYTPKKEFASIFQNQRNMNNFKVQKITFDTEEDYHVFERGNINSLLDLDILYDGINTIDIICTSCETTYMFEKVEEICNEISSVKAGTFSRYKKFLDEESAELIIKLSDLSVYNGSVNIDTYKVFMDRFGITF